MSQFWIILFPAWIAFIIGILHQLRFFSRSARNLNRVDIPNEVKEVRINEVEMLVGVEADGYFLYAWNLTRWQRRQATGRRLREARKWLHLIIANAVLFQEVARFHIEQANYSEKKDDVLARKVMDRANTVHLIAVMCLGKLAAIEVCRTVWPLWIPELADYFQLKGQDLTAWYRHLMIAMLKLVSERYDDVTYTRFIFQLTGLCEAEEAESLGRL